MNRTYHSRTQAIYGYTVGMLVLDTAFVRAPGALGNATTFDFPVLHRVVRGATGKKLVHEWGSKAYEEGVIKPFIDGAKELEAEGAQAITTTCGFTIAFQTELAAAVNVPVFASSLLLCPLIMQMLRKPYRIGIITADSEALGSKHLNATNIDRNRIAIAGLQECTEFCAMAFDDKANYDLDKIEAEVVGVAVDLVNKDADVRALLLECALLPSFAKALQAKIGLPIFDQVDFVKFVHTSLVKQSFI